MDKEVSKLYDYIDKTFVIEEEKMTSYNSLPICIIGSIYSLQAKYFSVTEPVIKRYVKYFMDDDIYSDKDTINDFINNVERIGFERFCSSEYLDNRNKSVGKLKIEVCYKIAIFLRDLGINTISDFKNFKNKELLENVIESVKGVGIAGRNYIFMLSGDDNRCKPDTHLHKCIKDALGYKVSDEEVIILFTEVTNMFKKKYANLTIRKLDSIIWNYYQGIRN